MKSLLEQNKRLIELVTLDYGIDPKELERAMWEGDTDRLDELAHCRCCCYEHTFEDCPARLWYGCRGQGSLTRAEVMSWARHYERFHGMTLEEFFNDG
jgi:hypothetical protein